MTVQELLDYYVNLLILQYKGKPKAEGTIEAIVEPVLMDQLPLAVQNGFSIDDAVGNQLDIIGKYAGATRRNYGADGVINLTDDDFRSLIKLQVIKNNSGSSLYDIVNLLETYFPGLIRVTDNGIMQLNYFLSTEIGSSDFLSVLLYGDYLPRPMGVSTAITAVEPSPFPYFGFRTYELPPFDVSPFNTYEEYLSDTPFLTYEDAII